VSRLRLALALAGFTVALVAVATENHWLGWLGIALLAGSLLARLIQRRRETLEGADRD
jgi:LPXTG-motif cell wall-anchored protein